EVRRRVGFVFTDPDNQIVMPTVAEDVGFSLRRSGLSKAQIAQRVSDTLARLGLAAVLVTGPSVIVADEPTTLLDLRNARMVSDLLGGMPEQLVLVTHHLH